MRIVVGGAGRVGKSIVSYLTRGDNDIVVIDNDEKKLNELARDFDVLPIFGSVSHPDILKKAEASKADLLIAVSDSDEVNIVASKIAHSFFGVPRKVVRVSSKVYLNPEWGALFDDENIPVDVVVSPDYEIAQAINRVLQVPGMSGVFPLVDNKVYLLSFRCPKKCPLLHMPFSQLERIAPDMKVAVVCIIRSGRLIVPHGETVLSYGDDVYLLVEADKVEGVVHNFGLEKKPNENIVIFGGNEIVRYLAEKIEEDESVLSCKIIDENPQTAKSLAESLNKVVVLNGPMMSDSILSDASITTADAALAITSDDKDNIIASMIARKNGVENTLALINSRQHNTPIINIGDNVIIDRTAITISKILPELRRARINKAHSLGFGFGEVWEISIDNNSILVGSTVKDLQMPQNSEVFMLVRGDEIIFTSSESKIAQGDKLVVFVSAADIKRVEKIFA